MNLDQKYPQQPNTTQRGGIAILVALVLVLVMGAAAFGLARNSIRELAIAGTVSQQTKADKAADAGLDWFITWSYPDNVIASEGSANAQGILAQTIIGLKRTDWASYTYPDGVTLSNLPWDHAALITSPMTTEAASTNDMVFDISDSAVRQNSVAGNAVVQKFDLELRFLGERGGGGAGDPTGGTSPQAKATMDLLWQVTSRGSANIPSAGISFVQTREAIGIQSRSQD